MLDDWMLDGGDKPCTFAHGRSDTPIMRRPHTRDQHALVLDNLTEDADWADFWIRFEQMFPDDDPILRLWEELNV